MSRRSRKANQQSIVAEMSSDPEPGSEAALDFDYRPTPLGSGRPGRSSLRWPIIAAALAMALIALIAVRGFGTISDTQAREKLDEYAAALGPFGEAIDSLESNLPDFDGAALDEFSSAVADLRLVATSELPGLPPFVPQGSLREVTAAQEHLLAMLERADSIITRLGEAVAFQTATASIITVPPLPFSAPAELVDTAAEAIDEMETATRAALAVLPTGSLFQPYVDRAQEILDFLPRWSTTYLDALRAGDEQAATDAISDLTARRQLLDAEMERVLAAFGADVGPDFEQLQAVYDQVKALTAG